MYSMHPRWCQAFLVILLAAIVFGLYTAVQQFVDQNGDYPSPMLPSGHIRPP
jgi:hypothetical protein